LKSPSVRMLPSGYLLPVRKGTLSVTSPPPVLSLSSSPVSRQSLLDSIALAIRSNHSPAPSPAPAPAPPCVSSAPTFSILPPDRMPLTNSDIDGGYDPTDGRLCHSCLELQVIQTPQYSTCQSCGVIQRGSLISDAPPSFNLEGRAPDRRVRPVLDQQGQLHLEPVYHTTISTDTRLGKLLARAQYRASTFRTPDIPRNIISEETVARRTEEGCAKIQQLAARCGLASAIATSAEHYFLRLRALEGNRHAKLHDLDTIAAVCLFTAAHHCQCGVLLSRLAHYTGKMKSKVRRAMGTYSELLQVKVPNFWDEVQMAIRYLFNLVDNRIKKKIDRKTGAPQGVPLSRLILEEALHISDQIRARRGLDTLTCSKVEVAASACLLLALDHGDFYPKFTAMDLQSVQLNQVNQVNQNVISRKKSTYQRMLENPSSAKREVGGRRRRCTAF